MITQKRPDRPKKQAFFRIVKTSNFGCGDYSSAVDPDPLHANGPELSVVRHWDLCSNVDI